jgi:hypothetical protein
MVINSISSIHLSISYLPLGSSRDELLSSSTGRLQDLVRWALYNTTCNRELGAETSEVGIDVASRLASLVDTPNDRLVLELRQLDNGRELTRQ